MQGFNMGRYHAPDTEAAPSFNRTSAKKANPTVRFELPFAVWCTHCKPEAIVGQGVRFNAEKKKVGNYYSTPIWSFRMKHTACGGWWEIHTDPKNAAYVVVDGARKRDYGPDEIGKGEGEMAFLTEEERDRRRNDAFASLEGRMGEKAAEKRNSERVEELLEKAEVWRDPYTANQKLRRGFRAQRKVLQKEDRVKEGMQDKFSFGFEVADELEIDRIKASLVEFGTKDQAPHRGLFERAEAEETANVVPKARKLKAEILQEKSRENLRQTLVGNTKAAIDPFLGNTQTISKTNLSILKRKRDQMGSPKTGDLGPDPSTPTGQQPSADSTSQAPVQKPSAPITLVDYDSD